jgi:hypothetical protein
MLAVLDIKVANAA